MPCNSWSRARHDIDGGGPRSKEHIYGKHDLSSADQLRVKLGNDTMYFTCRIVRTCLLLKIPCCIENPDTSMAWLAPPLAALVRKGSVSRTDYCQYGTPWRKRTRVVAWNVCSSSLPSQKCSGRGTCSRSGIPHIVFKGTHPIHNIAWTKYAEPYPPKWVRAWWTCIDAAVFELECERKYQGWLGH